MNLYKHGYDELMGLPMKICRRPTIRTNSAQSVLSITIWLPQTISEFWPIMAASLPQVSVVDSLCPGFSATHDWRAKRSRPITVVLWRTGPLWQAGFRNLGEFVETHCFLLGSVFKSPGSPSPGMSSRLSEEVEGQNRHLRTPKRLLEEDKYPIHQAHAHCRYEGGG